MSKINRVATSSSDLKDIFIEIGKKLTSTFTKPEMLITSYKFISNKNILYITLLYKNTTTLNIFKENIFFTITLSEKYPEEQPYVRCLTNFTIPTLYDNRNLLYSIINHYWTVKGAENPFKPIEEIIIQIPNFLRKVNENIHNKTLVYYGDYTIDDIYEMNDFLLNGEINFFRVTQHFKKKCNRYIILTDIYFLLFDPAPDSKNLGKLMFIGDIRQLSKRKIGKIKNEDTLIIEWTGGEKQIRFEFSFINSEIKEFTTEADIKIKRLTDRYKIYQEEDVKQGDATSDLFTEKLSKSNPEEITKLINYKEKLFKERKTLNLIQELIILYEKMIEILSACNDMRYKEYLIKSKSMHDEAEKLKDNKIDDSSKQIFQMSKSYKNEGEQPI